VDEAIRISQWGTRETRDFEIMTSAARPGLPQESFPINQWQPSYTLSVLGAQCETNDAHRKNFEHGAGAKPTLLALCELADRTLQQVFKEVLKLHDPPRTD